MNAVQQRERDEIRAALSDPAEVCRLLGIDEGAKRQARGISVRCPLHAENNPSCSVTKADGGGLKVRCFAGCDFGGRNSGGDEVSLVAAAKGIDIRSDFPSALHAAAEVAGVHLEAPAPTPRPRTHLRLATPPVAQAVDVGAEWERLPELGADAFEYLRDRDLDGAVNLCRGVPSEGLAVPGALLGKPDESVPWGIGLRFACALRDASGRIVGIQARNVGTPHDFRVLGSSQAGVFGEPQAVEGAANVVICEGLTDTLAAIVGFRLAKSTAIVGIAGTNNRDGLKALPWKGRRVFVAMDADAAEAGKTEIKGDEAAKLIADMIAAAGGKPIRLRPEGGKDLADMLAHGVDLYEWAKGAVGRALGFRSFGARIGEERVRREADAGKALSLGVPYLNDVLGGAAPRDVILIGAESGLGKTELATIIATENATEKKRVHYFALEPEPYEIERRIKFKLLSLMVYSQTMNFRVHMNYQDWHEGKLRDAVAPYEEAADRALANKYRTLNTFYRQEKDGPFTSEDFNRMARALTDETDLIVLDHVHYFDEGTDPNREQKRLARQLRELAISTGRPVIIVAHLRKKPSQAVKNPRLVPAKDEFEGSSHLFKTPKKVIILAPAFERPRIKPWEWPTYVAVVKNTLDGTRCRYVGIVGFNTRTNTYEPSYSVGTLEKNGSEFKPVDELPHWARAR